MQKTLIAIIFSFFLVSCKTPLINENISESKSVYSKSALWPSRKNIPVCWVDNDIMPQSYHNNMREIVETQFRRAGFTFTGWRQCTNEVIGTSTIRIALAIHEDDRWCAGGMSWVGPVTQSLGNQVVKDYQSFINYNVYEEDGKNRFIMPRATMVVYVRNSSGGQTGCEKSEMGTLLHEFGHALGFKHEHERDDAVGCSDSPTERLQAGSDIVFGTVYDSESIMNYCRDRSNPILTDNDVRGMQRAYRAPIRQKVPASTPILLAYSNGAIFSYPFVRGTFKNVPGERRVAHGAGALKKFLVADWNGDETLDIIAINNRNELLYYPFSNGSFYGSSAPSRKVGNGFNFSNYLVGDFDGDGASDLIVRTSSGELKYYPFKYGSFYGVKGSGTVVGHGFNFKKYFVADFNGDSISDLIVQTYDNKLKFYPFKNGSFYNVKGSGAVVGHGFKFRKFFIDDFDGDKIADIIGLTDDNKLKFYPFKNNSFYGVPGSGKVVGHGFNFTDYFIRDFDGDGIADLIGRTASGDLKFYPFKNKSFYRVPNSGKQVGTGFRFEKYLTQKNVY